jgi:hypothetical protein
LHPYPRPRAGPGARPPHPIGRPGPIRPPDVPVKAVHLLRICVHPRKSPSPLHLALSSADIDRARTDAFPSVKREDLGGKVSCLPSVPRSSTRHVHSSIQGRLSDARVRAAPSLSRPETLRHARQHARNIRSSRHRPCRRRVNHVGSRRSSQAAQALPRYADRERSGALIGSCAPVNLDVVSAPHSHTHRFLPTLH